MIRLTVVVLALAAPNSRAQSSPNAALPFVLGPPAGGAPAGATLRPAPGRVNFLEEYFRQSAESRFAGLTMFSERFYGLERYEAPPGTLAMEGAAAAATLGLFAGAVGTTAGAWTEPTSWYIVGAAALAGAFLGGIDANDPAKRTRYRWSIAPQSAD
jgi:hypothetical protein